MKRNPLRFILVTFALAAVALVLFALSMSWDNKEPQGQSAQAASSPAAANSTPGPCPSPVIVRKDQFAGLDLQLGDIREEDGWSNSHISVLLTPVTPDHKLADYALIIRDLKAKTFKELAIFPTVSQIDYLDGQHVYSIMPNPNQGGYAILQDAENVFSQKKNPNLDCLFARAELFLRETGRAEFKDHLREQQDVVNNSPALQKAGKDFWPFLINHTPNAFPHWIREYDFQPEGSRTPKSPPPQAPRSGRPLAFSSSQQKAHPYLYGSGCAFLFAKFFKRPSSLRFWRGW